MPNKIDTLLKRYGIRPDDLQPRPDGVRLQKLHANYKKRKQSDVDTLDGWLASHTVVETIIFQELEYRDEKGRIFQQTMGNDEKRYAVHFGPLRESDLEDAVRSIPENEWFPVSELFTMR